MRQKHAVTYRLMPVSLALVLALFSMVAQSIPSAAATVGTWPTYLGGTEHTGYNGYEHAITSANVARLGVQWAAHAGGGISGQPIVANNAIYWGSWDGYLHATTLGGRALWQVNLGTTYVKRCIPPEAGVASTPTFTYINGQAALVVGGGDASLYAVNAANGHIIWRTRMGASPATFLWSSPTIANGAIYIGISSFGDCPLVQGGMAKLNVATGAITATFHTVPAGCKGASIWGAPTLDVGRDIVYAATGNIDDPCTTGDPTYGNSVIALAASDLSLLDSWQVPDNEAGHDTDFGATLTMFTATSSFGGYGYGYGYNSQTDMLGVASKDGYYYAFGRDSIGAGPVWHVRVSDVGGDCTYCGQGSISTAAWDGAHLYIGGGATKINGKQCAGNLSALDTSTGAYLWRLCTSKPIQGPVSAGPGFVVAAENNHVDVVKPGNGAWLKQFVDTAPGAIFYSSASIVNGHIYIGDMNGTLFNFGV